MDSETAINRLQERFPELVSPIGSERASWESDNGIMLHLIWDVCFALSSFP